MAEQQVVKFQFIAEGKLSLDDFIIDFIPENPEELSLEVYFRKEKRIHTLEDFMPINEHIKY